MKGMGEKKMVVITSPRFIDHEADYLTALFQNGLRYLHLRKPNAPATEIRRLLDKLPAEYHPFIVLHDHFELTTQYDLLGVHLNSRNPEPPQGWMGHVSCSCHSIEEIRQKKSRCNYLFLSPIYDSISKEGYGAAFSREELKTAQSQGVIDDKVFALGGVSAVHLPEIFSLGFGGAAFLGDVWNPFEKGNVHRGVEHFKELLSLFAPEILKY